MLGEGNFVLVLSEGSFRGAHSAFYHRIAKCAPLAAGTASKGTRIAWRTAN